MSFKDANARLSGLVAFAAVATTRSYTQAARQLAISPSAVSQAVRRLEQRLGQTLLVRTTRWVRASDAGAELLRRSQPALAELGEALSSAASSATQVSGTLRLTVPTMAADLVAPILSRYTAAHPAARVEVAVSDVKLDLLRDGFDAGVRLEEAIPVGMVAVRISEAFRFGVVGAPAYLDHHGAPRTLRELRRHARIGLRLQTNGTLYAWELERRGRPLRVDCADAPLVVNAMVAGVTLAEAGLGLAYTDEPSVAARLAAGQLRWVLPELAAPVPGFFLYFPPSSRSVPRVRALVTAARAGSS